MNLHQFIKNTPSTHRYCKYLSDGKQVLFRGATGSKAEFATFVPQADRKPRTTLPLETALFHFVLYGFYGHEFPQIHEYRKRAIFLTNNYKDALSYASSVDNLFCALLPDNAFYVIYNHSDSFGATTVIANNIEAHVQKLFSEQHDYERVISLFTTHTSKQLWDEEPSLDILRQAVDRDYKTYLGHLLKLFTPTSSLELVMNSLLAGSREVCVLAPVPAVRWSALNMTPDQFVKQIHQLEGII